MGEVANYVGESFFKKYLVRTATLIKCKKASVCSAHGCSFHDDKCYKVELELHSDDARITRHIRVQFVARIFKDLPYDFVIGLPIVRRYKLTKVFDYIFTGEISEGDNKTDTKTMKDDCCRDHSGTTTQLQTLLSQQPQSPVVEIRASTNQLHCYQCTDTSFPPSRTARFLGNGTTCASCAGPTPSGQYVPTEVAPLQGHAQLADNQTLASVDSCIIDGLRTAKIERLNLTLSKEELLDVEDDTDHLEEYLDNNPHDKLFNHEKTEIGSEIESVEIKGEQKLQRRLRRLMSKYAHRLSKSLTKEPARLEAFKLELKEGGKGQEWLDATTNKQSARPQTLTKRKAIEEFIKEALELDLIELSQATSWSQVHIVPKANGKWRFCIDFRRLNEATKSLGWPLPNIKEMLERIGAKKPKHFAVLDLTSGYYQAAISKESRELTAFRTSTGLYQWKRLPMGLKGAPAFFQQAMQEKVLGNLLYTACEVYLDDIIVYGSTEEEFLTNLELVFQRLEQYNITLNPEKVRLGLSSIEYVGHTIDENGISFSKEKIQDVWNAPRPVTKKQLKSFLGLCVQFKDHIPNYSTLVQPLHDLLPKYSKKDGNHPVKWTDATSTVFEEVKTKVNDCPKLFFVDTSAPVFLHTDASNYGIGGYLFQVIDGKQRPIIFLSKALTKTERKWSVYEKEGFAIFYCLMKMEHLLRDSHFTLRTDHRNLIFINTDLRDKVKRWKLAIQTFDFDVEHIEGEKNIEADGFSRILTIPKEHELEPSEIDHDKLFILRSESDTQRRQFERLPTEVYQNICQVHNSDVGHFGVERTLEKLKKIKKQWKGMRRHVRRFIDRCEVCQKLSFIQHVVNTAPFTLADYDPFNRICIDTIGPLPKDNESNDEYILVIIDAFSRFVRLYPIPDTSAQSALKGLLDWIGLFGIPSEIVSDNGTQFANSLIEAFLELLEIDDAKIQAYSKEENAIVERANKEVNRHLRTIVYNRKVKTKWSKYLPLVQRIMNASTHSSTGVSPAQIVYGNAVKLDRNLLPLEHTPHSTNPHEYIADLVKVQKEILNIAIRNQEETDLFHLSQRGGKEITEFPPNSYVLVNYEGEGHKPPSKLHTNLRGPVKVISSNGPIYTVQDLATEKLLDFHVKLLHPFDFDAAIVDPREVAKHDEDYFDIDKIEDHKFVGTKKNRTDLEFLILFEGDKKASLGNHGL